MSDPLVGFIASALLRYFRKGERVGAEGFVPVEADRDILRLHWAISTPVHELARYVVRHPHEVRSALTTHRATSAEIRGRIRAADSVREQLRSADASVFVFDEPRRTHATGPNRVLFYTLAYAADLSRRFLRRATPDASYGQRAQEVARDVRDAQRVLPSLHGPRVAPTADDLRMAQRSRSMLYRTAAAAYDLLRAVERLDADAVLTVLSTTLIAPMERWRQFEFALALAMATAVGDVLDVEPRLRDVGGGVPDAFITVDAYDVRWQRHGPKARAFTWERWEQRAVSLLQAYDVSPGWDRPDIVIVDTRDGRTIAVGEAKYFESANWRDAFRAAATQIVDYARAYESQQNDVETILRHSMVAVWEATAPPAFPTDQPLLATFATLQAVAHAWAERLVADGVLSAPPLSASLTLSSTGSGAGG